METEMKWTRMLAVLSLLSGCNRAGVTQPSPTIGGASPGNGAIYALNGWVYDTAGRPIEGATLQVLTGPNSGATTSTDQEGAYAFIQPFAAVPQMRATKAGYQTENSNVFFLNNTSIIRGWFRLGSTAAPPVDLDGAYLLTFAADPSCTSLPDAARQRSYEATISDGRASFHLVSLRGASFVPATAGGYGAWNVLYITAFENYVRVDFSDPPIWELLNQPSSVYMTGFAAGTMTGPVTNMPLSGEFAFCGSATGGECHDEVSCESAKHTLTLTRR
jgi:hypothetical protein